MRFAPVVPEILVFAKRYGRAGSRTKSSSDFLNRNSIRFDLIVMARRPHKCFFLIGVLQSELESRINKFKIIFYYGET